MFHSPNINSEIVCFDAVDISEKMSKAMFTFQKYRQQKDHGYIRELGYSRHIKYHKQQLQQIKSACSRYNITDIL